MMAVQVCVLSGLEVRRHPNLNNMVYPVRSHAAREQLEMISPAQRPYVLKRSVSEFGLDYLGTNGGGEGSLCETSVDRVCRIFDFIFKGMDLFTIWKDGSAMRKFYGTKEWREMIVLSRWLTVDVKVSGNHQK